MAPTLTRTQFDKACKLFVAVCSGDAAHAFPRGSSCGWAWKEHASLPGLGFLSRSILLSRNPGNTLNGEVEGQDDIGLATSDDSEACSPSADLLTSHQSVVYSPTFQVPTFYFTLHDTTGSPLSLDDILRSPLFRPHALPEMETGSFALMLPDSSFALLSQGEHPTLGTPSWYFHPCRTAEVVGEIMSEVRRSEWTEDDYLLRWMEVWFMVLGNVVDFSSGI